METKIIFFGASWCGDCARAKALLMAKKVEFEYIDIDKEPHAAEKVIELNNGMRSIPTIIFPDGTKLVEPPNVVLETKLKTLGLLDEKKP